MNERIKELRKALGLTQQAFADRLGISRNNIATYETGKSNPGDSVVALICREFNADETWLRTGAGNMFVELSREEEISAFMGDILHSEDADYRRRLISALAKLNEDEWRILANIAESLAKEEENKKTDH